MKPDFIGFAKEIFEDWPDVGTLDGGDLQEIGERFGLLVPEKRTESCGEHCNCLEYFGPDEMNDGFTCFRKTPELWHTK